MRTNSKIDIGAVKIHKNVIASIASAAALEIEGVRQIGSYSRLNIWGLMGLENPNSIRVEFNKNDEIRIEIPLIVSYGYNIALIAESVQENVRQAIEKMIDKTPRDIHINIQGIYK